MRLSKSLLPYQFAMLTTCRWHNCKSGSLWLFTFSTTSPQNTHCPITQCSLATWSIKSRSTSWVVKNCVQGVFRSFSAQQGVVGFFFVWCVLPLSPWVPSRFGPTVPNVHVRLIWDAKLSKSVNELLYSTHPGRSLLSWQLGSAPGWVYLQASQARGTKLLLLNLFNLTESSWAIQLFHHRSAMVWLGQQYFFLHALFNM